MAHPFATRRDPIEEAFVQSVVSEVTDHGFTVIADYRVNTGSKSQPLGGYFDPDRRELAVASGRSGWVEILAHEYNHFRQWQDGDRWFSDPKISWYWNTLDQWLGGWTNPSEERMRKVSREIALCELDCERRTVKTLKALGYSAKRLRRYARGANAYVWSYEATRVFREWNKPGRGPYDVKELRDLCPPRLMHPSQVQRPPPEFLRVFAKRCL